MGVGVYSNDFNGTGETFIVSGPIYVEEDYRDWVKEMIAGEEGLSSSEICLPDEDGENKKVFDPEKYCLPTCETWLQDQYDIFVADLEHTIKTAGEELGMKAFQDMISADFDDNFVAVLDSWSIQVGWRSWEDDFIVGAAPGSRFWELAQSPKWYAIEILEETSLPPEKFVEMLTNMSAMTLEYIRIRLMENGFKCRFKTSGYTSECYKLSDDSERRKQELKAEIKRIGNLLESRADAIVELNAKERADLLCVIDDLHGWSPMDIKIPSYDVEKNEAYLLSVLDENKRLPISCPNWMGDFIKIYYNNDAEGIVAIPRTPKTEEWLADTQRKLDDDLVVTAEEYSSALKRDCIVQLEDDEMEFVLHQESTLLPTP